MNALLLLAAIAALAGVLLGFRARLPDGPATQPDAERDAAYRQLVALESGNGLMPSAIRADELRRLRLELAGVTEPARVVEGALPPPRMGLRSMLVLAVLVPALAVPLYAWRQGPYWQTLAQAPAVPPQARAMVARLEARLADHPEDAEGWKRLGRSYGVMGRTGDAQRAYARAAQLAPDDLMVLEGYGELGAPGPHPPAIAALLDAAEQAAQKTPANPRAWARLGFTRGRLGDGPGARDAYARAHALDPQRIELLAAYAAAEYALDPQRPSAQALALYRQLLAADADNPAALWVAGLGALESGDRATAQVHWQRLLVLLAPDDPMRPGVEAALQAAGRGESRAVP